MPSIKPVSDLRNYGEVLRDVAVGQPVFLTKNGRGRYAVIDMEEYREYEKMKAMIKENLPVVWAIYSKKGRLNLYRFNSAIGKYEVVASTNNHFVTAIAVEESQENQKLRRMIEVSSWGKSFYIDYDEYLEFVGNSLINKYCSNIMVRR